MKLLEFFLRLTIASIVGFQASVVLVFAQDTGWGCYDISVHECNCEPEVCDEDACASQEGGGGPYTFTNGCGSCACDGMSSVDAEDPVVSVNSDVMVEADEAAGWGCYDLVEHSCNCMPDVCNEVMCAAQDGDHRWTDGCTSCQCGALDDDDPLGEGTLQIDDIYQDYCKDAGIATVEECGEVADGLCFEYEKVDKKYMATFSYEDTDKNCGPKYCVVRCVQGGHRYEICGQAGRIDEELTCHDHDGQAGYGCFSREEHQCDCDPEVCNEEACVAQGEENYYFSDNCSSCQCAEITGSKHDHDGHAGYGCFSREDHQCNCDPEVCNEEACVALGEENYYFSDNCSSCQCAEITGSKHDHDGHAGYGCFSREEHQCSCDPEVCNEEACVAQGEENYYFSDNCSSCQCAEITGSKHDHDGHAGYGCFSREEHQCSCDPDVCSESACLAQGEENYYFSDNCSSCQCDDATVLTKDYENYCTDTVIDSVDECGDAGTYFCVNELGFKSKYMTTYSNEHGDCGHKYCVVRCERWGTRYALCGEPGREPTDLDEIDCEPDPSDDTGHEHAGVVGYGCLNRAEHQCMCEPENCDEQLCLADGNYWSDNCSSCQCAEAQVTAEGHYDDYCADTTIDSVEECGGAGTDFCFELGYDSMYITTYSNEYGDCGLKYCTVRCESGGTKYQLCGQRGREPSDPENISCEHDGSDDTGHVHGTPVGYGCYDEPNHQCVCDPDVCSEETCLAQGEDEHSWSDNCSSCQCANVVGPSDTIGDVVCAEDDFSILCSLIKTCPNFLEDIGQSASYTVFAPNDSAFEELNSIIPLNSISEDTVCEILEFHVAVTEDAPLYSVDLNDMCESGDASLIEMMNDKNARVKCTKRPPEAYGIKGGGNEAPANFVAVDIDASNGYGVIHEIDTVLFFPRVIDPNDSVVLPSFRSIP